MHVVALKNNHEHHRIYSPNDIELCTWGSATGSWYI